MNNKLSIYEKFESDEARRRSFEEMEGLPLTRELLTNMIHKIEKLEDDLSTVKTGVSHRKLEEARNFFHQPMSEAEANDVMGWRTPGASRVAETESLETPVLLTKVTGVAVAELLEITNIEAGRLLDVLGWEKSLYPATLHGRSGRWWYRKIDDTMKEIHTGYTLAEKPGPEPDLEGLF